MIVLMGLITYFVLSNVMLTYKNGVYNHINKLYMTFLMMATMGLTEGIVNNNKAMMFISVSLMAVLVILIRNQILVDDRQFAKGMIEHHDMALLMASKIKDKTKNPEVKKLAENILSTQQSEIDLMKTWI